MQVSVEVAAEEVQYVQNFSLPQEKLACDILAEKLRAEYEDEQRAIKELDEFLKPAVIVAKNGKYSNKHLTKFFRMYWKNFMGKALNIFLEHYIIRALKMYCT